VSGLSEWVEFNAPLDTIQVISEAEVSGLAFALKYSVVFAGNAIDIMRMLEHAHNLSLFLYYIQSLAIKIL